MTERPRSVSQGLLLLASVLFTAIIALAGQARAETFDHCGFPLATPSAFTESDFSVDTDDGVIRGTLAVPDGAEPKALVLMLHGFRGARNENGGMFRRTAHTFAQFGLASLRIDFLGSGRSDGDWADTRFSTQARDAVRAAEALSAAFGGVHPVSVLGYSQGGLVALRAAAGDDVFERVAVWAPPLDPLATYQIIFGRETILEAAARHREIGTDEIVEATRLRSRFFVELAEADPIGDAAQSAAPLLIVTGERDPLVKEGEALAKEVARRRNAETNLLHLDAGHDFGALREPPLLAHVVACTARYLAEGEL